MRLFVACRGKSYILDFKDGSLDPSISTLYSNRISNFGYAWANGLLYALEDEGLVEYTGNLRKLNIYKDIDINEPDHWGDAKETGPGLISSQFNRAHQFLTINHIIYCVDTGHEVLRRFDTRTKTWLPIIRFLDIPWAAERGVNWVNSLNFIDDKIYFVTLNHGWSSLLIFDKDMNFLEGVDSIGFLAHNIWKMHGKLWTLSSGEGYMQVIGKKYIRTSIEGFKETNAMYLQNDQDGLSQVNIGGYTRGVAISEKYLFVGITQIRNSASPESVKPGILRPPRSPTSLLGINPDFGVAIFDVNTLNFLTFIRLPDARSLHEIRLIDERDYAIHVDPSNEIFPLTAKGKIAMPF